MKHFILPLLFLAALPATAQYGQLKGRVRTTDGEPAAYVNITIPSLKIGTISSETGYFSLSRIRPGHYQLVVSCAGLKGLQQEVSVEEGKTLELSFSLSENRGGLDEVVVDGRRSPNIPVSIGKMPVSPMDLPQSISVIGQGVMREQQANRLSDVIRNVNGVYLAGTRASTQESFYARGYSFGSNNLFKNGSRVNSGVMPEISSLERVEVLKGSAAILYGNVAPGGIINMVTKQPKFHQGGELSIRSGSYGLFKPAFDVYGPVSANLAYRVNGTFETADSYRDQVSSKRYYINPSFLAKLGSRTELLVQADYLKHQFTPDFGIGSIGNNKIAPLSRSTFLGTPWQNATTEQSTATVTLRHQLGEQWQLAGTGSFQQYQRDYYSTERIQALENGDWARPLGKTDIRENYTIAQADLTGRFNTGKIAHTLLAGADAEQYFTTTYSFDQPAIYDTINILDPGKYARRTDIPEANKIKAVRTPVNRFGAYVQDLISLSEKLKLLAGIRWSYQETRPARTTDLTTGESVYGALKSDNAFSPRAGLVYKPFTTTSLFASYANSFVINSGTDVYGNGLDPSIVDQVEAGVKNDFFNGMLTANLTVYRIINNNLAQTARFQADGITPNNNTALKELTGQTTSDGVELDVTSNPVRGLTLIAGYSHNYMRYTQTPDAKGNYIEGERLVNTPSNTANASAFYTFGSGGLAGLKLGASVLYIGDRFGGWNNTIGQTQQYSRLIAVDGFTTVDISAGYTYKKISFIAKVSNLTNTFNYYVHENYSINPIAPRQFIATAAYRF